MEIEFWGIFLPLVVAIIGWLVNEWRKRFWEQYQRREASYKELLRCLTGFYEGIGDAEKLRRAFLDQMNQCWLYCPDEVINKGYAFLDTVHSDQLCSDSDKEKVLGDFVAAIRKDVLPWRFALLRKFVRRTRLTGKDFRHFGVNRRQEQPNPQATDGQLEPTKKYFVVEVRSVDQSYG